jgi:hypothetical protein
MGAESAPPRVETAAGTLTATFTDTDPTGTTPQQAGTVVVTPAISLVDTTTPPSSLADTTLQHAGAATHPATTASTKEPDRGLSDPSFATCFHPNGPRTSLLWRTRNPKECGPEESPGARRPLLSSSSPTRLSAKRREKTSHREEREKTDMLFFGLRVVY